jgi:flagellar biosynthesis protein FlhG
LLQGESSDAYRSFGLSRLFSGFWKQKNEGVE